MVTGSASNELIKIVADVKWERDKSWLVTDGIVEAWLPKSQCEIRHIGGTTYEFEMPHWLAAKAGFIE